MCARAARCDGCSRLRLLVVFRTALACQANRRHHTSIIRTPRLATQCPLIIEIRQEAYSHTLLHLPHAASCLPLCVILLVFSSLQQLAAMDKKTDPKTEPFAIDSQYDDGGASAAAPARRIIRR